MKLIKCPKCGEMYSDSYRTCPFCQEDEALKGRAAAPRRKVTRRRRAPSILGPAMVLVVVLAAVLVGVLLFGGKGNAEKPDDPAVVEPDPAPATPLTLDQTTLNLNQAETAALTVTGAEDVLWTSSDTNVATVDDTGLVTAGIPGTATITVTTADGSQSAACTVNVATPLPEPPKEKLGLRSICALSIRTRARPSTSSPPRSAPPSRCAWTARSRPSPGPLRTPRSPPWTPTAWSQPLPRARPS